MKSFVPLSVPNIGSNELNHVLDAVQTGWVMDGAYNKQFEDAFALYSKVPQVTAVQSGTAALHLAMLACGVEAGDLVIVPTLTFVAAVNPVRYMSADPVFIDCDDSLCMDPVKLREYLEEECVIKEGVVFDYSLNRPIRAIVVVHVFGNIADMESIMGISSEYKLPVIEDACEAVGSFYTEGKYSGCMAGTIGEYGAYSFNGNKIMTTGGGGMFVAKDAEQVQWAKYVSTQAKSDALYYDHDQIGYNYRMSNMQAALGLAQLVQLETFINIKHRNYDLYNEMGVSLLPFKSCIRPNFWFYSFLTNERDALMQYLLEQNVQTRPIWKLIHTLPMYEQCKALNIEKAFEYSKQVVNLPCSTNLECEDVKRVVSHVKSFNTEAAIQEKK